MLFDKENMFSDKQEITTTAYSTNSVKFGKGDVSYLPLLIVVNEDFEGLSNMTIEIQTSATADFGYSSTAFSSTLLASKLKAGATFPIAYMPKGNRGYMRIKYQVSGTATAGSITAGILSAHDFSWHDM